MRAAIISLALLVLGVATQAQLKSPPATYVQQKPAPCHSGGHYVPTNIVQFECGVPMGNNVQWQTYSGQFEMFSQPFSLSNLNSTEVETEFLQPVNEQPGTFSIYWSGVGTDGIFHRGTVAGTWTVTFWRGWCYPTIETSTLEVIE